MKRFQFVVNILMLCVYLAYPCRVYGQGENGRAMEALTFFGSEQQIWSRWISTAAGMIAIEDQGIIVFVGDTYETKLPVSNGAYQKAYAGSRDAYIAIVNLECDSMIYCSYLGGEGDDNVSLIHLYKGDKIIIGGGTSSAVFPLPNLENSKQTHGGRDGWIACFDLRELVFEYFYLFGGKYDDSFTCVDISESDDIILGGYTQGGIVVTENAFQDRYNDASSSNMNDGFCVVMKDSVLAYSTYYGGISNETVTGVQMVSDHEIALVGYTESQDLYITENAYINTFKGGPSDSFMAVIDTSSRVLPYGTFIGGDGDDATPHMRKYGGKIFVWSRTTSTNIKTTENAMIGRPVHETRGGPPYRDSYLLIFDIDMKTVEYCTYISGDDEDAVVDVQPLSGDRAIIAISTGSSSIMGIDRAYPIDLGSNFVYLLDYKNNLATFICNSAFNGWADLSGITLDNDALYGFGDMSIRDGLRARDGAIKEEISGADDVIIMTIRNVMSVPDQDVPGSTSVFSIYPNPAKNYVTISFENEVYEDGMLVVANVLGKVVLEKKVKRGCGIKQFVFDSLPNGNGSKGVYLVCFIGSRGVNSAILVIQ